jgi:hypothetical protein
MRLLDTSSIKLQLFLVDIPQYAILSHTWGEEEVTFQDIHTPEASKMKGYSKVVGCCAQARKDGYKWVWIDTCCINKADNSELSECEPI